MHRVPGNGMHRTKRLHTAAYIRAGCGYASPIAHDIDVDGAGAGPGWRWSQAGDKVHQKIVVSDDRWPPAAHQKTFDKTTAV